MTYEVLHNNYIALQQDYAALKEELDTMKRLIFGSKKESFKGLDTTNQLSLFEDYTQDEIVVPEPEKKIKITYEKTVSKKHEGRNEIPSHLPVVEVVIEPEEDTTGLVKIKDVITETLEYTPASLVKKITRRPVYAKSNNEGVIIANLPSRPIDKGIAEASLLAHIFVSKFIDHLPFYRQLKIFKRNFDWELSSSTINDWFVSCCNLLEPLYKELESQVMASPYIQADESPIRVLDKDLEGSSHQGYQWVCYSVSKKMVLMKYSKGRSIDGLVKDLFMSYKGLLQCDGYAGYDAIATMNADIELSGCLAHVRRKYFDAQTNDKARSQHVLNLIQKMYLLERDINKATPDERKAYRKEHTAPILEELKTYIETEAYKVVPKSNIGKAIRYTLNQWTKIIKILDHGELQLDNNLIENKIRPLALGRKNYLFAGSHDGGQRVAMMYSFFGTCAAHGINPYEWLRDTLSRISDTRLSDLYTLIPGYAELKVEI
jgi:transposase